MGAYILLDTETTGKEPTDRICQLAICELGRDGPVYTASYCKPPLPISFFAMSVHGITNEQVEECEPYASCEAASRLAALNREDSVLIAHNAKFDIDMLKKEGVEWNGGIIDTFRCAKHLMPEMESHALQYLRYALGFYKMEDSEEAQKVKTQFPQMMSAHNALFDIFVLKQLLSHLNTLVQRDAGKLISLTNEPVLFRRFHFGKYKGQNIDEVVKKDKGYLEWMLNSSTGLDDDMRYTLKHYLGHL
jgi:DNA polymerase III epsilon subunit-like protein